VLMICLKSLSSVSGQLVRNLPPDGGTNS
jgi:hypothetical protein